MSLYGLTEFVNNISSKRFANWWFLRIALPHPIGGLAEELGWEVSERLRQVVAVHAQRFAQWIGVNASSTVHIEVAQVVLRL